IRGPTISPRLIRSRIAMSMYWSEPRSRTVVTPACSVRIAPLRARNTSTAGELLAICFSIGTPGVSSVYNVMCVCTSINPGSPKYFVRSTTSACAGIRFASVVTSRTRSPSTITIAFVHTFPFPSHNFPNRTALTFASLFAALFSEGFCTAASWARSLVANTNPQITTHITTKLRFIRVITPSPRSTFDSHTAPDIPCTRTLFNFICQPRAFHQSVFRRVHHTPHSRVGLSSSCLTVNSFELLASGVFYSLDNNSRHGYQLFGNRATASPSTDWCSVIPSVTRDLLLRPSLDRTVPLSPAE